MHLTRKEGQKDEDRRTEKHSVTTRACGGGKRRCWQELLSPTPTEIKYLVTSAQVLVKWIERTEARNPSRSRGDCLKEKKNFFTAMYYPLSENESYLDSTTCPGKTEAAARTLQRHFLIIYSQVCNSWFKKQKPANYLNSCPLLKADHLLNCTLTFPSLSHVKKSREWFVLPSLGTRLFRPLKKGGTWGGGGRPHRAPNQPRLSLNVTFRIGQATGRHALQ